MDQLQFQGSGNTPYHFMLLKTPFPPPTPPPNKKAFASKMLLKVFISRTYRQKFKYCLQNIEIN